MLDNSMQIFLALFSGYVVTSMILLRHPTLLYRKKKIKFSCRHISHRGGAGENYENTITAFKRAVALGTDMLEIDCHLTKDNQVVVCHDSNLIRNAGLNQNIADLNYNELPLLKTTLPIDFDPGVTFNGSPNEEDRRIPLLREVFELFPSIPINIDVKANNDILIQEIDKLITKFKREEITVWGSFSNEITYKCYLQNPKINLLFSLKQVVRLILLFYTGLLPFFPIKETHLEIFQPSMYLRSEWRVHCPNANFVVCLPKVLIYAMDCLLMSRTLFNHLKSRGIQIVNDDAIIGKTSAHNNFVGIGKLLSFQTLMNKFYQLPTVESGMILKVNLWYCNFLDNPTLPQSVICQIITYVWVLNRENEFKKVYDMDVTGIMTDYPTRLRKFLDENPHYQLDHFIAN